MTKKFIPYGRQFLDASDRKAVLRALQSDYLTQGPGVDHFEEAFAKKVGAPYAVAVSSGTAALHLAWLAAGLRKGDEVITTPITFVATSNSVLYAGGSPVFADVDPDTGNLASGDVKRRVTRRTRGVSPVHFAGLPAAVDRKRYGIASDVVIVEDACHALGAGTRHAGKWTPVGACRASDMTVFSFHPVKHITTGEGGMITTAKRELWERLRLFRSHGIHKNSTRFMDPAGVDQPWYYEMQELGFNYRITDLQCALGLSQLKHLDAFVERRRKIAGMYRKHLGGRPHILVPHEPEGMLHSYHLFVLQINFTRAGKSRQQAVRELAAAGVGTQVHYIPVNRQPYYQKTLRIRPEDTPQAAALYERLLSIPMFPKMTDSDVRRVCRALDAVLG